MAGVAKIKSQYLIAKPGKTISEEKISAGDVITGNDVDLESNLATDKDNGIVNASIVNNQDCNETRESDTKKRRKKEKGQNKKRPRTVPLQRAVDRLCPSLSRNNSVCDDEEKCQFSHNVEEFIKNKPEDIDNDCINFKLRGKCNYGLECRFAKCHLTEDLKNLVNEEKQAEFLTSPPVIKNILKKEIQTALRKKQFLFPKTDLFLKCPEKEDQQVPQEPNNFGAITENITKETTREIKPVDFSNKLFLAPLTTVGNLPFRRICKRFGADITCSEMAMSTNLLQGQQSEWALLKRHQTEDVFGIQVCGSFPDSMSRCAEMLNREAEMDFIDINIGCPIDLVFKKGGGCALMGRMKKFEQILKGMVQVSEVPITVKMRTGIYEKHWTAHNVIPKLRDWGASLVTLHGRSREQRYTRNADWDYIKTCADAASPMPLFGNGDILSFEDANQRRQATGVSGIMIARGALIKPWIFTEIKEERHWDISSSQRLDILKEYVDNGLEHWGSDHKGVENTRRFLLEWLSFLHRYIPVGVLEVVPQKINERPPHFIGRDDLETLMASNNCNDWVKISEMLLGPVPSNFNFLPKHKANSYA